MKQDNLLFKFFDFHTGLVKAVNEGCTVGTLEGLFNK